VSTDKQLLDWFEFVATKFQNSRDGWIYTRDTGDLVHIRHKSDYTGYQHWTQRIKRVFTDAVFNRKTDGLFGNFPSSLAERISYAKVILRKDSNLPDGRISNAGIITHWEEDGEYITLMGPTVGVKVLEFLKAEPDNQHAKEILAEMHRMKELSWPSAEQQGEGK
jgi:hypothetical protein